MKKGVGHLREVWKIKGWKRALIEWWAGRLANKLFRKTKNILNPFSYVILIFGFWDKPNSWFFTKYTWWSKLLYLRPLPRYRYNPFPERLLKLVQMCITIKVNQTFTSAFNKTPCSVGSAKIGPMATLNPNSQNNQCNCIYLLNYNALKKATLWSKCKRIT